MESALLLDVHAVHYRRHEQPILRGVDLQLRRGEVLGLLGQNGAGKSTTLALIAGVLQPDSGYVRILEHPASAPASRQALGYLPEQVPLYHDQRLDDYLDFCARLRRLQDVAAAREWVKQRCGLTQVGRKWLGQLSKGYQQRVGIAQALIHRPPLLILDEPSVGLDPKQLHDMRALIKELRPEHGIILSSHQLAEVEACCDRVVILHQGQVLHSRSIQLSTPYSTLIRLRHPPALEQLSQLPGVQRVDSLGPQRFRLVHPNTAAPISALQTHASHWGLEELYPEPPDLERLFLQLTLGRER